MNAHEATAEGGTIDVRFGREHSTFFLSVSDTGPGIPAEEIEQIFEPFFTTKARGTGLGLSVVHQIVTHHGGEIRAFNKPDGGACFLIRIPLGQGDSDG
jgi:signal transduction histidine kinase